VNRVVFGLHDTRDDENRPLNERRAPASARQGVVSELRACPYHDERKGSPINVTALAQTTRHLEAVARDVARFRGSVPEQHGWDPMLVTVVDSLSAPGLFLLRHPGLGRVPAETAVAYKVAAGFFGALRHLLELEMRETIPVTPEGFLGFVARERLLIGPSEACAGPPGMIRRLTEIIMRGESAGEPVDPERLFVARALAQQVRLGVAWGLYDEAAEQTFFREWHATGRLKPKNDFIRRKLEDRAAGFGPSTDVAVRHVLAALPCSLPSATAEPIRLAVTGGCLDAGAKANAIAAIGGLLEAGEGAIDLADPSQHRAFASRVADYLVTYRAFAAAFWELERALRGGIGVGVSAPLKLHGAVFGPGRTLDWQSAVSGHRLASTPESTGPIVLRSHRRAVEVIPGVRSEPRTAPPRTGPTLPNGESAL